MPEIQKRLLRLAMAIRAELAARRDQHRLSQLPSGAWDRSAELVRQIRRAETRGWQLAAAELRSDLRSALFSLESEVAARLRELPGAELTPAKAGDIYQDLVALAEEFGAVDYDLRGRSLSVTTEPITLEDVYLGPFEIRLDWSRPLLPDTTPYRVIATEPHPAQCREGVTHPHVMDEILCEGDGRQAIRQALFEGRLLDFFTLIAVGLRTYNRDSPFAELALWYGSTCSDCGAVVDEDDRYTCQRCGDAVCGQCEVTCAGCEDSCCSGCAAACPGCDQYDCPGCLRRCGRCRAAVCPDCLDDDERCPNCHAHQQPPAHENTCPPPPGAAPQPHGLGQAALPARCR